MSSKLRNLLIVFIIFSSLFPLIASILLAEFLPVDGSLLLIAISVVIFILGILVTICIDYSASIYKCKKCGHAFKPAFKPYLWSMHTVTSRYLKCPECKEKSWCKIAEEKHK